MALTTQDHNSGNGEMVTVDRTLWLTADQQRVVEDGDPQAATLYATPGMQVPHEQAERYGLLAKGTSRTPGDDGDAERDAEDDAATKSRTPSANKARTRRQDK